MAKYSHVRKFRQRKPRTTPTTSAERLLKEALERAGETVRASYRVETVESFVGYYVVDLYIPSLRLFVEVDGGVHISEHAQWKDRLRTEAILKVRPGCTLVRVWNHEVEQDPDGCAARLVGTAVLSRSDRP